MDNATVVKSVRDALKKHTHRGLGAKVLVEAKSVFERNGWWYVPVRTSKDLKRVYDFYDVLAMAEEDLQSHKMKIALIPA